MTHLMVHAAPYCRGRLTCTPHHLFSMANVVAQLVTAALDAQYAPAPPILQRPDAELICKSREDLFAC